MRDAERYVEHWAVDQRDLIVDERGTSFCARAEKPSVRLEALGSADWSEVRERLAAAGCDVAPGGGADLFDAVQAIYGLTR